MEVNFNRQFRHDKKKNTVPANSQSRWQKQCPTKGAAGMRAKRSKQFQFSKIIKAADWKTESRKRKTERSERNLSLNMEAISMATKG